MTNIISFPSAAPLAPPVRPPRPQPPLPLHLCRPMALNQFQRIWLVGELLHRARTARNEGERDAADWYALRSVMVVRPSPRLTEAERAIVAAGMAG